MVKDNRPAPPAPATPPLDAQQAMQLRVQSLDEMRTALALALMTMEQNTDRISAWLAENRETIIVTRHQIARAIAAAANGHSDLPAVLSPDTQAGKDVLSFLASDDSLLRTAESLLGPEAPLTRHLRDLSGGLPAHLIEPLPDVGMPDDPGAFLSNIDERPAPPAAAADSAKTGGGLFSGLFKNQQQRDAEAAEAAYQNLLGNWRAIHRDMLGIHSDRHYYVDSFMDWVGENLAPSTPNQNFAALMTQYRHPAYVIAKAQEDYNEALHIRTRALLDDATLYSNVARPLDEQNIPAFIDNLPQLFPRPDHSAAAEMRRLLLRDFNAGSLADIALASVKAPAHRVALLEAALAFEGKLDISGSTRAETVLDIIRLHVTRKDDALPVAALTVALRALKRTVDPQPLREAVYASHLLRDLTRRFENDDIGYTEALVTLFEGMGSLLTRATIGRFVMLRRSLLTHDAHSLGEDLDAIENVAQAAQIRTLWDLTAHQGQGEVLALIKAATAKTPDAFTPLADRALELGLAREIMIEGHDPAADTKALRAILDTLETSVTTQIAPAFVARLLAVSRLGHHPASLDTWRRNLPPALRAIAQDAQLPIETRLELIAAYLGPFSSLHDRLALLETAAQGCTGTIAASLLSDAAWALNSDVYQTGKNAFLVNPANIANIWYAPKDDTGGALLYTVGAKTHTLIDTLPRQKAVNILDILHARYGFAREDMGLFSTALADGFEFGNASNRIIWDMHEAPINITRAQADELFATLPMVKGDTVNGQQGQRICMHPRALLAVLPMPDGTSLVIDRNGNHQTVSNIHIPAPANGLHPMGKAWVNPDRASLLSLDEATQTLNLRVENPVFIQLLEALARQDGLSHYTADGQYLSLRAGTRDEWKACTAAIAANPAQLAPAGDLSHLRFNMDTLSYLTPYREGRSCGLSYSSKNKGGINGRIEVDADIVDEVMQGLCSAAEKNDTMLAIRTDHVSGGMIVNGNAITNIFYQPQDAALMILTEHSNLCIATTQKEALRLIKRAATQEGYTNIARDGQPPDLLRLDRATQLYTTGSGKDLNAFALTGNREVTLGMSKDDFIDFVTAKKRADWQRPRAGEVLAPVDMRLFANACKLYTPKADQPLPPLRSKTGLQGAFIDLTSPVTFTNTAPGHKTKRGRGGYFKM